MPSHARLATLALVRSPLALACLLLLTSACTPKKPPRYVIETDVAGYHYRRYQKVLDIELPIAENPAVGHTATYVRSGQELQVLPVFVTVYQHGVGLAESIRHRLRAMEEYTLDVKKLSRENVWQMRGESGDVWLLWISGKELVKIGAPEGEPQVPTSVVEAYLELYPSDLNRRGRGKSGAESAGPAVAAGGASVRDHDATEP
ncbi:MAG: hypothetical protein JWN04_3561 [Myxococcaceae bacterium]|nr:hypothetical protein [Myxococcaceae bacterium]